MGYPKLQTKARIFAVVCATLILTTCLWVALNPAPTHAVTTIPTKINFQGRLTDSSGNIKPNGLYNIKFRLFDALSAGTNKFEEDYIMTGVDNRVQVTNGLFNVQFGTLTSLASFDFSANPNLWLEVELPTPATATCNTNACAVFTEGAMSPRQPLASAPYAFNADKLDGVDGSQFARNDAANTFTTGDQAINRTSLTAFQIQNAGSTGNLFIANTTNTVIGIGAAPSAGGDILQVTGSVNASTSLKVGATTSLTATTLTIASTSICTSSGCAPSSGSTNYIQNQTAGPQASANFNISGNGTVGGIFRSGGGSNGAANGDIVARRSANTGAYYFGDGATNYLYFDGTNYNFGTGGVVDNGTLAVAGTSTFTGLGTFNGGLTVNQSTAATSGTILSAQQSITATPASASTGSYYANYSQANYNGTASTTGSLLGNFALSANNVGAGINLGQAYGSYGEAYNSGAGTIGTAVGALGLAANAAASSGTVTTAIGVQASIDNLSTAGAGFTNAYGLQVTSPIASATGTIANDYGVYIAAQKAAGVTNAFGVYQFGVNDANVLNGATTLGSTLAVTGTSTLTGNVGIGAAPVTKLSLNNGEIGIGQQGDPTTYLRIGMDSSYTSYLASNAYWTGTANNYVSTGGFGGLASRVSLVSGAVSIDTASGGVNPITWNGRLYVANNGNVGIGNAAGSGLLSVGASSQFQVSSGGAVTAVGVNAGAGLLQGAAGLTVAGGIVSLNVSSSSATNINTGSSSGAVAIGNASAGAIAIQSGSTVSITSGTTLALTSTGSNNINITPGGGTNTGVLIKPTTDSTAAFQVQNASAANILNVDTTNSIVSVGGANSTATISGTNLITNTTNFTAGWSGTNWVLGASSATHTAGSTVALTNTAFVPTAGSTYEVVVSYSGASGNGADSLTVNLGASPFAQKAFDVSFTNQPMVFVASTTAGLTFTPTSAWAGSITSVQVFQVTNGIASLKIYDSSSTTSPGLEVRASLTNNDTFIGISSGQSNTTGSGDTATGAYALYANTTGTNNAAYGKSSLAGNTTGNFNAAFGSFTLSNNTTGLQNTATGAASLNTNTTGNYNSAVGAFALNYNSIGNQNSAIGVSALQNNTIGGFNSAIGTNALLSNISGNQNSAMGSGVLQSNTTGFNNTGTGFRTLFNNTTGTDNTGDGVNALFSNSTGVGNTGIGELSGYTTVAANANTTGSNNTFIGIVSGPGVASANNLQRSTAIGTNSVVNQNDSLVLGCISGVNNCAATTLVGIANASPGFLLHVGSAAIASGTSVARFQNAGGTCTITPNVAGGITCTSDRRLKKDITTTSDQDLLNKVLGINVVNYRLLAESSTDQAHTGVIAQDFITDFPDLVQQDADGNYSVSYAGLTPYLAGALQAQQKQIVSLQQQAADPNVINLNVSGKATIASLEVVSASISGDLTVTGLTTVGDIAVNGHIITGGTAPVGVVLPAAGDGATVKVEGNDSAGTITIMTGAAAATAGDLVKLTFTKPFGASPRIVLEPMNVTAATLQHFVNPTTTSFIVSSASLPAISTTYIFSYHSEQ